jgi:hypothetical protein
MGLVPSPTVLSLDEMGRIAPPIIQSVGRGGVNRPGDVFVIQSLLNDRLPKPHSDVPVTGKADFGTVLAIEAYQAVVQHMYPPTGKVDPGSATYYALAARPMIDESSLHGTGHFGVVPPDVVEAAIVSRQKWSVPASVTLAQWAVESAWGAAMPPDSNNPFGIKAVGNDPAVDAQTREVVTGKDVVIVAKFRKFASIAEAFDLHGKLLATNPVYAPAMAKKDDPEAFSDALTGVYATDPLYGATLKYVIKTYNFTINDK